MANLESNWRQPAGEGIDSTRLAAVRMRATADRHRAEVETARQVWLGVGSGAERRFAHVLHNNVAGNKSHGESAGWSADVVVANRVPEAATGSIRRMRIFAGHQRTRSRAFRRQ